MAQGRNPDYHFSRDYPKTPTLTIKPTRKIAIVNRSSESLYRPHDLILHINHGDGNTSMKVGKELILGSFPDKRSAERKRIEIHKEYHSANTSPIVSRSRWDPKLEIVVKPSSLRVI